MSDPTPEISVVVPVRDEAENIDALLEEIHAALHGHAFEIIYVDDGSTDTTPSRLQAACGRYPELRVLHHRHSAGQSAGLATGIRAARGTWIATLDGDGQNDPADIPKLFARACAQDAPALVAGLRIKRKDTALKPHAASSSHPRSRTPPARAAPARYGSTSGTPSGRLLRATAAWHR